MSKFFYNYPLSNVLNFEQIIHVGVSTLVWYKILGLWSTTNMTLILVSSYGSMYRNKCVVYWAQTLLTFGVTQKWDLWVPCTVHRTYKTDKKLKSQRLPVTIHMNSNHCPLIECAAAGEKKKEKRCEEM